MRLALFCLILSVGLGLPSLSSAKRVYAGQEAVALRCANAVALTGTALASTGGISDQEKKVMLWISVSILERHVSGTWAQKKSALRVMQTRRTAVQTLDDYRRNAQKCLKQFPIN